MSDRLHEFEKQQDQVENKIENIQDKCTPFLRLFNELILALSDTSSLHFNTLFARVSFIISRYHLSRTWSYALQLLRKELKTRQLPDAELINILQPAVRYLLDIYKNELNDHPVSSVTAPALPRLPVQKTAGQFKKKYARVTAIEWLADKRQLIVLDEEFPDTTFLLLYNVHGVNDIFTDTVEHAVRELGLPLVLGLINVETAEENQYIPSYIVIVPDLLMDVTSIASAHPSGNDPSAINLIELFLPSESTEAILAGQVANYFLDELIHNSDLTYSQLFMNSFKFYPIEFVQLNDDQLKVMYSTLQLHYDNIKYVIEDRFPALGIDRSQCIIEPSYFSPRYGIKGRLDLFCQNENGASIIELKGGRPFKPNSYGLSSAHYHQTLLYELLIRSVHGPQMQRANYILYSAMKEDPLRYAASIESIQKETIQNRNELVLLQFRLAMLGNDDSRDIMSEIEASRFPDVKGFIRRNIDHWEKIYSALSPGEKQYFKNFTAFITREHLLARIGNEGAEGECGLAGLWLDSQNTKEEQYRILQGLKLTDIQSGNNQTLIRFAKTSKTNPIANFRAGDIAIVYPGNGQTNNPTEYQLYRANIIHAASDEVIIRLRNNQVHIEHLKKIETWNIEQDLLDSSFRGLYQSLWAFMSAGIGKRQLIYGLVRPARAIGHVPFIKAAGLTPHQEQIFNSAITAGPLYLLWGPPGTGKTSRMLRSWVWYYFYHTTQRIALVAYTNRAVDEICEALQQLGEEVGDHYIRIGSRAGTSITYHHRLLDTVIEPMKTRKEIKALLNDTRIFVATVSSLQGKSELFKMIHFDVGIIDEASQILEPSMTGLMTRFDKSILIGDHMQLPAVCTQTLKHRILKEAEWSQRIGLRDLGMSYFERMFRLYKKKNWDHVIGLLSEQGRMHKDIQAYANRYNYGGSLQLLNSVDQSQSLENITSRPDDVIFRERLIYIPSQTNLKEVYAKTNADETQKAVDIIRLWQEVIQEKQLKWNIGVITPFRAQIAAILHAAHLEGINMEGVTVDTVERYQGGARDIIIMSAAVNHRTAMQRIISLNDEGIDRKLNVAVTRARQQFILIGNPELLLDEKSYKGLIEMCSVYQPSVT